jgi:hypothetical protein
MVFFVNVYCVIEALLGYIGLVRHTRENLTTRQQDVFAASLSTSCNNAVIFSSCYKVVTHKLLTNC